MVPRSASCCARKRRRRSTISRATRQVRNLRGQRAGDWPNTFRTSRLIPAVEYMRAQRAGTQLIAKFEEVMADWDVLVMPPNVSSELK